MNGSRARFSTEHQSPHVSQDRSWSTLKFEAATLLCAGAWRAVSSLLTQRIKPHLADTTASSEVCEAIGILLIAESHLADNSLDTKSAELLQRTLALGTVLSPDARLLALIHTARRLSSRGKHREAIIAVCQALESDPSLPIVATYGYMVRARAEARLGRLSDARQSALAAIELAQQDGATAFLADSYVAFGNVLSTQRSLGAAQRIYAHAATIYWRLGDTAGRSSALLNRASTLLLQGEIELAHTGFRESEAAARRAGRVPTELRAQIGVGAIASRTGDLHSARSLLLRCASEAHRLALAREEVLSLEYLADAYMMSHSFLRYKGRIAAILARAERVALASSPGQDVVAELLLKRSIAALLYGNRTRAIELALQSLSIATSIGLKLEQAQALRIQATALAWSGEHHKALTVFRRALCLYACCEERPERETTHAWIHAMRLLGADTQQVATPAQHERAPLNGRMERVDIPALTSSQASAALASHPILGPLGFLPHAPTLHTSNCFSASSRFPEDSSVTTTTAHQESPRHQALWCELGFVTRHNGTLRCLICGEVYAQSGLPILILGETGTGKDLLANGIHRLSQVSGRFVPVNCAAIHPQVFLAELFGVRRGAFTGASENRAGLIQEASGGTLFLDEIGDLDPAVQGYLLRFLDSGEVRPVGSTRHITVQARVLTATSQDLPALVSKGRFRSDLFARVSAISIHLPNLQDRACDFDLLLRRFWVRLGGKPEEFRAVFTSELTRELRNRRWSGNCRQLRYAVEEAIALVRTRGVSQAIARIRSVAGLASRYPVLARPAQNESSSSLPVHERVLPMTKPRHWEHRVLAKSASGKWPAVVLLEALNTARGHVPTAAKILGLSRSQAYRLYKQLRESQRSNLD